jgi:uncharacterized membrane protein
VPHVDGGDLVAALGDEWPSFFGFGLSFVSIGIMWMNHHGLFKDIERTDHTLLVLNVLLLLCISFVPFSTAVLAEYLEDGDGLRTATLLYAGNYTANAVFFNALWLWAYRDRHLIDDHVSETRLQSRTRRYVLGPLAYGLGIPLALVTPWITLGLYTLMAALYLAPLSEN